MTPPSAFLLRQLRVLRGDTENVELARDAGVTASHEGFAELGEMLMEAEDEDDIVEALKAWPVKLTISMTYERWDVDAGETSDHGFYGPGGWYHSITDDYFRELEEKVGTRKALDEMSPEPTRFNRLDEAADYMASKGAIEDTGEGFFFNRSMTYRVVDPDRDYATGENTYFTFHVDGDDMESNLMLHGALQDRELLM